MTFSRGPAGPAALSQSRAALERAGAALRAGDSADAERTLRQHLIHAPDDVDALVKLAELLSERDRRFEATIVFKRALAVAPRADAIRLSLAQLLEKQGLFDAALMEVRLLGEPIRSSIEARTLEAALLGYFGRHDEQIPIYEELLARFPQRAIVWIYFGNTLRTVGRTDEAIKALRKAIKLRPNFGEAYWHLSNLKTFRFADRDIAAMGLLLRGKLNDVDAIHFHFALGKALEERADAEGSFRHYSEGNRIRAAQLPPEQSNLTPRADGIIDTFDEQLFDRVAGAGHPARDPIFIVGLQRSGSTLVEQILASHPMIEGTSELTIIEQIWRRLGGAGTSTIDPFGHVSGLEPHQLELMGSEYIERTRAFRRTGRPFFVDKLPGNWLNVGLIRLILPNARIIDTRRHPLACGFSNFKQLYQTGVAFSYDLGTIGQFYRDYLRVMSHFDRVQPGKIHHLLNEHLIDDPEGEVRRLLDFVGVPFDPACLDSHQTRRAVQTPSSEQVRRPINRDGVDQWRRYEPWLGPLKDALGEALENWDKPAAL
jgi:tetratricopeptide (TPR) repeat protein